MFLDILGNKMAIYDCFPQKDEIKIRYNATFHREGKCWTIPISKKAINELVGKYGASVGQGLKNYLLEFENCQSRIKLLKTSTECALTYDFQPYIKNATLMRHQQVACNIAEELRREGHNGIMLDMEMGTGKTMTAMAYAGSLKDVRRILIICPKISLRVWEREYERFANYNYIFRAITGTAKKRVDAMNELIQEDSNYEKLIACINYEYVPIFEKILDEWKPDLIICDESHKIKSSTANQTKAIIRLGKKAKNKMCLTGTPLTNNVVDFFSQYKFLDSSILGDSLVAFKNKYIITGFFNEYIKPNPATFEELKYRLGAISYRVTKEECLDLPPYQDVIIPITLDSAKMKKYKEFEREFVVWLNEQTQITAEQALTQTLKLRQLTGGFCYDISPLGNRNIVNFDESKADACIELIEDIVSAGNKVIVFAEFRAEIEKIFKMCTDANIKAVTYYGGSSDKMKDEAYDMFVNGDAMVFIGQIESAGISITLTNAKYTIFYSTGYKYGSYDQARSRMHRKGQTQKCTYYHLIATDTIDEKICKSLESKEYLAQTIIDSYKKGE